MGDGGLVEVFLNEAREILDSLENDLVALEERGDAETVNRLFRAFHTLKGSSGIAGFGGVSEFTHSLENLLDLVRNGKLGVTGELIDALLKSIDWIRYEVFGGVPDDVDKDALRTEVLAQAEQIKAGGAKKTRYYRVKAVFRENIFTFGIDPLIIMEDLAALGELIEVIPDKRGIKRLSAFDPEQCALSWKVVLKTDAALQAIHDVFMFVADDNQITITDITADYLAAADERPEPRKLGDILIKKGIVTERELEEVLDEQSRDNKKIGEIIVEKGLATAKELNTALGVQEDIRKKVESHTVRVDTFKLDNLMNLLGEIVIGQASLTRIADTLDEEKGYELKNALYGLDRITREFQEQIMSIRMIPVGPTFDQFKRFVRDISHQLGKEIRLEIDGRETELDKTVIEKIGDPLKHMIRNSIDHGIETTEERVKAGKQPMGVIHLNAYHQEGSVFIEVRDDGRGLDYDRIRAKAISRGIITASEEVSEERLRSFIFLPAFSTADKVSDLSGRGVGMDVVKSNIDSLRGTVELSSTRGKGTVMRIKLPLTLAIIDGMLFRVGKCIYIVPLLSIVESIQPKQDDIRTVKGKGEVVLVRGEYISLVRLFEYFKIDSDHVNPWEALLIIVETNGQRLALMIDDLIGQQQIVIKSLDSFISNSTAISGAAILGDGSVALIIDIHGMLSGISNGRGEQ